MGKGRPVFPLGITKDKKLAREMKEVGLEAERALKALKDCLDALHADTALLLRGLQIQLHHPSASVEVDSSPESSLHSCPTTVSHSVFTLLQSSMYLYSA